jgi:hypothetical protein
MLIRILLFTLSADPDPAFHLNADPDSAVYFNADPGPAFHSHKDPDRDLAFKDNSDRWIRTQISKIMRIRIRI